MKITKQQLTAIQQIVMEELYLEAKNQLLMEVGEGPPHYYPDAQPGEIIDDPGAVKIDQHAQSTAASDEQGRRTEAGTEREEARRARGDDPRRGGRPEPSFWQRIMNRVRDAFPDWSESPGERKQKAGSAQQREWERLKGGDKPSGPGSTAGWSPGDKPIKFGGKFGTGMGVLDALMSGYQGASELGGKEIKPLDYATPFGPLAGLKKFTGLDPAFRMPDWLPRAGGEEGENWSFTDLFKHGRRGESPGSGGAEPGQLKTPLNPEQTADNPYLDPKKQPKARYETEDDAPPSKPIAESQEHNTLERWSLLAGVKK